MIQALIIVDIFKKNLKVEHLLKLKITLTVFNLTVFRQLLYHSLSIYWSCT